MPGLKAFVSVLAVIYLMVIGLKARKLYSSRTAMTT